MRTPQGADKLAIIAHQKVKEAEYWKKQLAGESQKAGFPYTNEAKGTAVAAGNETAAVKDRLSAALDHRLWEMSNHSDYTLHVILTSGVAALLYKYTGHQDIMMATPIYKQVEEGEYVNTILPLRVRVHDESSLKDLLMQVRQVMTGAVQHQSYPVELLINRLMGQRQRGEPGQEVGLVETAILLRNIQEEKDIAPARPTVTFSFGRTDSNLEVEVRYRQRLYSETGIRQIIFHLEQLYTDWLKDINAALARVEMVSAREKQYLLETLNLTGCGYPRDKNLYEFFQQQEEKNPDRVALEGPSLRPGAPMPPTGELATGPIEAISKGEEPPTGETMSLTYRELQKQAQRIACILQEKGVEPDTIVAIMVPPALEMIIGILGILKAGGAYLPIDPKYPRDRIDYMLKDSGTKWLVTAGNVENIINRSYRPYRSYKTKKISATSLAYIIYTSGTTGKPKGVLITHDNVVRLLFNDAVLFDFNQQDVWTLFHSFCFDFSVWEMYGAILNGGRLVIIPRMGARDLREYREILAKKQVTVLNQTPSAFYHLLEIEMEKSGKELNIRVVIFGGEALQPGRLKDWKARYPKTKLVNMYGITETTVHVTYKEVEEAEIDAGISNIGKPIPTLSAYVMDRNLQLLPGGVAGELCVGGAGVGRGYLNRPDLTSQKFITNPHRQGETIYRSGDLVRLVANSDLEYLGRIDHQVKIRGYRIELGEIENRLLEHEEIKEALVIAADSEINDKYLCAYLVTQEVHQEIPVPALREYLLKKLPDYMVPTYFLYLEHIPLTVNGKVDRKALPRPETRVEAGYIAPRDKIETRLVDIWADELGIEKEKISIDADFFRLGGHSLRATRVIARIHKELEVNIPLVELFESPFVRTLAERIKGMAMQKYSAVEPVEKKEYYTLSSGQKRLYILQQMDEQGVAYNIPSYSVLTGEHQEERLEKAFKQLINRHESLRTSFRVVKERPVQVIHGEVEFAIEYNGASPGVGKSEGLMKEFTRPFELAKAPLIRASLVKLAEEKHVLAVEMHHIISDGVSGQILLRDFSALYSGAGLAWIRLQYKDYAEWQNHQKSEKTHLRQKEYWENEFKGEIPVLNLPLDYPRPVVQSYEGRTFFFEINRETTAGLKTLAGDTGTTLYMVILSLYTLLLSKLANQEDIVVGTPIAGRKHADLEEIIGMFVNTLALRNFPTREKKFSRYLQEVKEKALNAFENQDYQYEDLVEQVAVRRDVSRNPLFDIMFILQNMETQSSDIPGLTLSPYEYRNQTSKFDWTLTAMEAGDKLFFTLEYCTKIFSHEAMERYSGYFKKIIAEVLAQRKDDPRLWQIEIIPEEEKQRVLRDFNDTGVEYPVNKTIHRLYEEQVEKTPDRVALVGYPGLKYRTYMTYMTYISYRELNEQSNLLAGWLIEKGVLPDTIVGIMMERTVEMIIGILGILKAGGAYLPIDPGYPQDRVDYMLKDSSMKIVLTGQEITGLFSPQAFEICPKGATIHPSTLLPFYPSSSTNLAYVIYTSGSTGKPKGVMITHRNVVNFIQGMSRDIPFLPGKTILTVTTISFDIFVLETLLPLTRGMEILLASEREQIDPDALAETMLKNCVRMAQFTPSRLKMVLSHREGFAGLRYVSELLVGGEAFPIDLFTEIKTLYPGRIFNMFGPTETTVWSTFKELTAAANITIGGPVANTRVYILDAVGAIQPLGVVGDLYIGGDGVTRGYLNRPELTAEKFVSLFYRSNRSYKSYFSKIIYKTGDLARWLSNGEIEFLGRSDHQIKIRGFRIELGEIENQLLMCPGIDAAAVIDRDRDGKKHLCAYFVSKQKPGISELKSILVKTLPDYMIPSYFIQVEKIPLMLSGKIDRKALESYDMDMKVREEYTAPRDEIEQQIAELWKEVLNLEKVGVNENFFDLGGTSLDILRLGMKLKEVFNEKESVVQMFRYPTIISFAEYLGRKRAGKESENDIRRSVAVDSIKKSRQSQRNKRMKGGVFNG